VHAEHRRAPFGPIVEIVELQSVRLDEAARGPRRRNRGVLRLRTICGACGLWHFGFE
jgi:hypothetical protein